MKKFVALFLALALCMGLAIPALAADGYEEVTIEHANFFGTGTMGRVTIDQAKAVTSAYGLVSYYEVPAQVEVTVTLNENTYAQYLIGVRWLDAEFTETGYSAPTNEEYALVSPSGSLTAPTAQLSAADYQANQLTPGQTYTFTVQTDGSDVVILDCGYSYDFFLQAGIQLRYAGTSAQPETPEEPEETTEPEPSASPFGDVASTAYYYEPVLWAVEEGITTGRSATTFAPNDTCTEANILTFLWRAYGEPAPKAAENPFGAAVNTGSYYYNAALWAYEQGMIDETFNPNTACTRAQAVYFMWVAAGSPDDAADSSFTDVAADASYADAVNWAVEQGVTTGRSKTVFAPADTCTRGNIVTFLYRDLAE